MNTLWEKYAGVLVDYSTKVQKGDLVVIRATSYEAQPLVKEIYKQVLLKGANPVVKTAMDGLAETFIKYADDEQLGYIDPMTEIEYEKAEVIARKFSDYAPIQSQLMTIYMRKGDDEKAEVIAQNFSDYAPIQSQLMTIYMRKSEYEKAKEIAQEFQDNVAIQSQLMTIYMRKGEYEKAKEIAQKFPNNNVIQNQLTTNYMKVEENEKIIKNAEEISSLYKMIIQTENQEFPKKIFEIRSKISMGTISVRDLDTLESFKEQLDLEKYLLIRLAIYEKLGLLNVGRNLLRQDKILDDKVKKELIGYFERKSRFYNLEKWDILIGWFNELEEFEEKSPKEYLVDSERISKDLSTQKCPVTSNVQNSNNDFWKVKNNVVDISKKTKKTIKVTSSKIGEQKKKKVIKNKNKTLNDMLNQSYKEMILNLKIKYYKKCMMKKKENLQYINMID